MSFYCVGGLYGQYLSFKKILNEINFTPEKDKMFLLGNIIYQNKDSLKILKHILTSPESFQIILGVNEEHFLRIFNKTYLPLMDEPLLKQELIQVLDKLTKNFNEIDKVLFKEVEQWRVQTSKKKQVDYQCLEEMILSNLTLSMWANKHKKRKELLESLIQLLKVTPVKEEIHNAIQTFLKNSFSKYDDKAFRKEILSLNKEEALALYQFLKNQPKTLNLTIESRTFHLISKLLPSVETKDEIYLVMNTSVYGLHQSVKERLDFNYREILSYQDRNQNVFYHLNIQKPAIGILRLDDLEEFYVVEENQKLEKLYYPPNTSAQLRKYGLKYLEPREGFPRRFLCYEKEAFKYLIEVHEDDQHMDLHLIYDLIHDASDVEPQTFELPVPFMKSEDILIFIRDTIDVSKPYLIPEPLISPDSFEEGTIEQEEEDVLSPTLINPEDFTVEEPTSIEELPSKEVEWIQFQLEEMPSTPTSPTAPTPLDSPSNELESPQPETEWVNGFPTQLQKGKTSSSEVVFDMNNCLPENHSSEIVFDAGLIPPQEKTEVTSNQKEEEEDEEDEELSGFIGWLFGK